MAERDLGSGNDDSHSAAEQIIEQRLAEISANSLDLFEKVAADARLRLHGRQPSGDSVLAIVNTLTAERAVRALASLSDDRRRELIQLCAEPAIARVVVLDEADQKRVVFIARATPQLASTDGAMMASYRAPMGRLAAIPVGSDYEVRTPEGPRAFEVVERAALNPVQTYREDIPASDLRIQSWSNYRHILARAKLGILRTSAGRGFIMPDNLASLQDGVIDNQIAWFTDFDVWQKEQYWLELKTHAERLASDNDAKVGSLGLRLLGIVGSVLETTLSAPFLALNEFSGEITDLATNVRTEIDGGLRRRFAQELRRDNQLLDNLLIMLKGITSSTDSIEDIDDPDAEEDVDEVRPHRGEREQAFEAYKQAVRAQARAAASKRSVGRRSRNGRILEWLGPRSLQQSECLAVGSKLQVHAALRRFANPLRQYIDRIPTRYRRFRRERQGEGKWYLTEGFESNELYFLEADAILLAMLRSAGVFLRDGRVLRSIEDPRFEPLRKFRELYRTQVVVDEATDFSPLQLGCMAALCDPAVRSFLACGDFNQRVTAWGSRSIADLEWVFPDIEVRRIDITYRHSRQLNDLARRLAVLSGSDSPPAQLPPDVSSEGVAPVLAKGMTEAAVIDWLSARIVEIERLTGRLPSIAILVNTEEEVQPLAQALNRTLSHQNIRVVACPEGKVVGQDNDVRVFDVQYIKGLEFEAVFFVSVDELAARLPTLFDKYLYVGATRAATYLGLTCSSLVLPQMIAPLEDAFTSDWNTPTFI